MNTHPDICLTCADPRRLEEARYYAGLSGLALVPHAEHACGLQLVFRSDRTDLFDSTLGTGIHVDFVEGALAHRLQYGGGRGQAIAKAVGLRGGVNPSVLDATAGLARDAWVLASLGCTVTLVERSTVLYALLMDGIRRGMQHETSRAVLVNFMNVVNADAVLYMQHQQLGTPPDVVYIDPMFPERRKSAAVKKDMQILQKLHGTDNNNAELLETAIATARKRVVIKRPMHAEHLCGRQPSVSVSSRKTRFDVYVREAF